MQEALVQHYLNRAVDMFDAMVLLYGDKAFRNSSALLAIHSAISYSDALRAGLGDENLSGDGHDKAADTLQAMLARYPQHESGVSHLRFLLSRKNVVAYSANAWSIATMKRSSRALGDLQNGLTLRLGT